MAIHTQIVDDDDVDVELSVFVTLSNYFRVLQPQVIREGFDLVVDHIGMYRLFEGFELQADFYGVLAQTLLYYGLMVLALALVMGIFMYFMRQTIIVMSRLIEYDIRKEIFAQYESLTSAFYKRNKTGDLMARVTEDVSKVRMYLGPAVLYGINLISTVVLVLYSMLQVSVELTLYSLAPLPFLSISIKYGKKSTGKFLKYFSTVSRAATFTTFGTSAMLFRSSSFNSSSSTRTGE